MWGPAPKEPPPRRRIPPRTLQEPGSRCLAPPPRAALVTSQPGALTAGTALEMSFSPRKEPGVFKGDRGPAQVSRVCSSWGPLPCTLGQRPQARVGGPFHPPRQCASCTVRVLGPALTRRAGGSLNRPRLKRLQTGPLSPTPSRSQSPGRGQPGTRAFRPARPRVPPALAPPGPSGSRAPPAPTPPRPSSPHAAGARTQLPVPQGNSCRHSCRKCSRTAALTVPGGASMAARPSRPAGC